MGLKRKINLKQINMKNVTRRSFITTTGAFAAGSMLASPASSILNRPASTPKRVALVGTGVRGVGFWGTNLVRNFSDSLEFVGLSDINEGRLNFAKEYMGVTCPTFVNFDEMLDRTKPELVIVTTMDSTHDEFIIKSLDKGIDVLTEKPLTTTAEKCQAILDAERRSNKEIIVGFNYRWSPYKTKIKELLSQGAIGKLTSVDFHWYLNNHHGASYFRRWHGLTQCSGSLWVHKATHHFDLVNWWIDSDPEEVHAYGSLEHYGSNGPFRGKNCRECLHRKECKYFWDITGDTHSMNLYVKNEQFDGYIRDNCVYRNAINIWDKMSAQVKYANNVIMNYSLTTYSPYEGFRIAFNGTEGRLEAWENIPFLTNESIDQKGLHDAEMNQDFDNPEGYDSMILHKNWNKYTLIKVGKGGGGHGGGDIRLQNRIFRTPDAPDPLKHSAGSRDGAMSILVGVAARKSIDTGLPVKISDLTDIKPDPNRLS